MVPQGLLSKVVSPTRGQGLFSGWTRVQPAFRHFRGLFRDCRVPARSSAPSSPPASPPLLITSCHVPLCPTATPHPPQCPPLLEPPTHSPPSFSSLPCFTKAHPQAAFSEKRVGGNLSAHVGDTAADPGCPCVLDPRQCDPGLWASLGACLGLWALTRRSEQRLCVGW